MLLQNTLTPYTVILEEAFNQKLLTEEEIENGSYYFAFDTGEMLKLTPEDQAEYMINLYNNNIVTLEEVRARLMLGGDEEIINALSKVQDLKEAKVQEELENATKSDASSIPEENNENESGNTSDKETPVKEVKK